MKNEVQFVLARVCTDDIKTEYAIKEVLTVDVAAIMLVFYCCKVD